MFTRKLIDLQKEGVVMSTKINFFINEKNKKILKRRFNKAKRDPKGFIQGSYKKRSTQLLERLPIKYSGNHYFTVVSAVYNVEKYLNDYFKSLVGQNLDFKKHIQLILVDDGSTDSSAKIIKEWQKKYPKNIKYFYKENGGQASARNLGINEIETEWVTFIDPDDFIALDYFHKVDTYISKEKDVCLISCPFIFYFEDLNTFKDNHPLKYRFDKNNRLLSIKNLNDYIQLSVNSAFFRTEYIKLNNVRFNEKIKPNFEDAKFVGDYTNRLLQESKVAFITGTSYFYRKRSDGTSTLDGAWTKPSLYSDVLSEGCLSMLEEAYDKFNYVPRYLQKTVLYHLSWYFKYIVNNDNALHILNHMERLLFLDLLSEIFLYIDKETIMSFNLSGIWFLQKVGILGSMKKELPDYQIVYVENVDRQKKQILISYFTYFNISSSFILDSLDVIPKYEKTVNHDFVEQIFVQEKRCWIPYEKEESLLTVDLNGEPARITLKGKQYIHGVHIKNILKIFKSSSKYRSDGSWLLMDRDTKADDNAEHMYRYLMHNHPEQEVYFALNKRSHDWQRLELEGFSLLDFGSPKFESHLRKASKVISSHLDMYIHNYFGDDYEYSKKFVFLQHGITMNNLSSWFNSKKNLHCVITTTKPEYQSLVADYGRYKLTRKEVALTGFPRHDSLLLNNKNDSKVILIMPTWRKYLVGKTIGVGSNMRTLNDNFIDSDYAQHWRNVLHSSRLRQLVTEYNYKVIFAPHANIEPYITMFEVPEYIDIWLASTATTSMQQLFQQAKIMITDYSSVAFEIGLLNKSLLYYQFDKEEFFSGTHTIQRGYFSYENDGFGPVVTEETELLIELEKILDNKGDPLEPYLIRMQETFAYRDTNNCKRVYEAIIDLDRPDTSEVSVDTIMEYAQQAIPNEAWDLALERINNALQHSDITQTQVKEITQIKESVLQTGYQNEPVKLANILWQEKRLEEALDALKQINDTKASDELLRLRVRLAILDNDFVLARDSQKLLLENYNEQCTTEDWQFYTQLASI